MREFIKFELFIGNSFLQIIVPPPKPGRPGKNCCLTRVMSRKDRQARLNISIICEGELCRRELGAVTDLDIAI